MEAFNALFAEEEGHQTLTTRDSLSLAQRLRVLSIPASVRDSRPELTVPERHPMDPKGTFSWIGFITVIFVAATRIAEILEKLAHDFTGTRFVPGGEPWRFWHRALGEAQRNGTHVTMAESTYWLGSTEG